MHIIIKQIKLYTNHINVLADNDELLKYIKIWYKIKALFNNKFNKKGLHNKPAYNNEYIKTKISSYNENVHGNKKLTKDEYYGHSVLLLGSICEVENKFYHQTFLDGYFECNSNKTRNSNNRNSLLKELVQIIDWPDDKFNNEKIKHSVCYDF